MEEYILMENEKFSLDDLIDYLNTARGEDMNYKTLVGGSVQDTKNKYEKLLDKKDVKNREYK